MHEFVTHTACCCQGWTALPYLLPLVLIQIEWIDPNFRCRSERVLGGYERFVIRLIELVPIGIRDFKANFQSLVRWYHEVVRNSERDVRVIAEIHVGAREKPLRVRPRDVDFRYQIIGVEEVT